jgi:hypothetical protein
MKQLAIGGRLRDGEGGRVRELNGPLTKQLVRSWLSKSRESRMEGSSRFSA